MKKKIPFLSTIIFFISGILTQSHAQNLTLSGEIHDFHTQKPIAFTTVSIKKLVKRVKFKLAYKRLGLTGTFNSTTL